MSKELVFQTSKYRLFVEEDGGQPKFEVHLLVNGSWQPTYLFEHINHVYSLVMGKLWRRGVFSHQEQREFFLAEE